MTKWDSLKSNKFLSERYRIYMNKHGNMYNDEIKRILDQNFIDNIGNRQIYSVFTQLYDRFGAFREDENYYVEHLNKIKNIFNIDCNVIEIGAGCCPTFASRIAREQFKINRGTITVYDPNLIIGSVDKYENMKLCKTKFEYDTDISKYDLVVGIMPCLCTNNIIEALSNVDVIILHLKIIIINMDFLDQVIMII